MRSDYRTMPALYWNTAVGNPSLSANRMKTVEVHNAFGIFALASNPLSARFLPQCGKDDFARRQHLLCSVSRSLFRSIGDCIDSIFSARFLTPKNGREQEFCLGKSSARSKTVLPKLKRRLRRENSVSG